MTIKYPEKYLFGTVEFCTEEKWYRFYIKPFSKYRYWTTNPNIAGFEADDDILLLDQLVASDDSYHKEFVELPSAKDPFYLLCLPIEDVPKLLSEVNKRGWPIENKDLQEGGIFEGGFSDWMTKINGEFDLRIKEPFLDLLTELKMGKKVRS